MEISSRAQVLFALLSLLPGAALADCERQLDLSAFRAAAFRQSPTLAEFDRHNAEQIAEAFEMETLRNPELQGERTFTSMEIGGANDDQSTLMLTQPFKLSHFGKRSKVAELIRAVGDTEKSAKLLEFSQQLLVHYYQLYALQKVDAALKLAEQRATKKVSRIHAATSQGLLSVGDEKLFDGERYRLEAEREGVRSRLALLRSEISKLSGLSCEFEATEPAELGELPTIDFLLERASKSNLSETARLELQEKLAQAQDRLAELDVFPEIAPRFVYQHTNDGGDFYGAGITVPLPLWDRNQAARTRTAAHVRAIHTRRNFLVNEGLRAQLISLREAALSSSRQASLFQTKVVPSFEAALASQERLYTEGKGNVIQVWQTSRAFNEVQAQSYSLLIDSISARVQLSLLVGEELR